MKVAAVQFVSGGDIAENLTRAKELISTAAGQARSLLCCRKLQRSHLHQVGWIPMHKSLTGILLRNSKTTLKNLASPWWLACSARLTQWILVINH